MLKEKGYIYLTTIIYVVIVFMATLLGAVTGTGGGVIIKPMFDLVGLDTPATIGVYSMIAVLSMTTAAIIKHSKSGQNFNKTIIFSLSLGSVLGGILGENIFRRLVGSQDAVLVTKIQSMVLVCVLIAVLLFTLMNERLPKWRVDQPVLLVIIGLIVGAISVFIGIGGGPLNIIVLLGLLSMTIKESAAYSIAMIFFAQFPKLVIVLMNRGAYQLNYLLIPLIALAAILGGHTGTLLNIRFSNAQIKRMYFLMMTFIILICLYQIFK